MQVPGLLGGGMGVHMACRNFGLGGSGLCPVLLGQLCGLGQDPYNLSGPLSLPLSHGVMGSLACGYAGNRLG